MKKMIAILASLFVFAGASAAWSTPIELLQNGNFEADLASWTTTGDVSVVNADSTATNFLMNGKYARIGFNVNGTSSGSAPVGTLLQTFSVAGFNPIQISFNYWFHFIDTTNSSNHDNFLALYAQGFSSPVAVITMQQIFSTSSTLNGNIYGGFNSGDIDISQYLGTNGQVLFSLRELDGGNPNNNNNFTNSFLGIDNVSVLGTESAPVPEPGTMILLGAGMLGLAIFGKRRMNKA